VELYLHIPYTCSQRGPQAQAQSLFACVTVCFPSRFRSKIELQMDDSVREAYVRCQGRLRELDTVGSMKYPNYTTQELINTKHVPPRCQTNKICQCAGCMSSCAVLSVKAGQDLLFVRSANCISRHFVVRRAGHVASTGKKRCIQGFGGETGDKETTWKTQA